MREMNNMGMWEKIGQEMREKSGLGMRERNMPMPGVSEIPLVGPKRASERRGFGKRHQRL